MKSTFNTVRDMAFTAAICLLVAVAGGCATHHEIAQTADSDGDGIDDTVDKCWASVSGQTIGPDGCPVRTGEFNEFPIFFVSRKSEMVSASESQALLKVASEILNKHPVVADIFSNTDLCSDFEESIRLSQSRANVVIDLLTKFGVRKDKISRVHLWGNTRPIRPSGRQTPGCDVQLNNNVSVVIREPR